MQDDSFLWFPLTPDAGSGSGSACWSLTSLTMSDITINICNTEQPLQGDGRKRKDRCFYKKTRHLEKKGYMQGNHQQDHRRVRSRQDQNRTSSKNPSLPSGLPGPGGAWSGSSAPSLTATVLNRGCREGPVSGGSAAPGPPASTRKPTAVPAGRTSAGLPTKYLAMDCEMVGTGPKGRVSSLARCSIVSYEGDVVYDKYVNPSAPVTDYRTRWSGIRRSDLVKATPYSEARKEILRLLMGKVVIGHAIHNDFKVLGYSHPAVLTRDTSRMPPLNRRAGFADNECASLKRLTKAIFNREIQTGRKGHSSVEDARATMELYRLVEAEWERTLASE